MIKKLVYSYTLAYEFNLKNHKRDYKLYSSKRYVYGDDQHPIADEINYYLRYYKNDGDFYDYLFSSDDVGRCSEFSSDEYNIYSFKQLTNDEIIEKFEMFMANRIKNTVLHLQDVYSDIRNSLDNNYEIILERKGE